VINDLGGANIPQINSSSFKEVLYRSRMQASNNGKQWGDRDVFSLFRCNEPVGSCCNHKMQWRNWGGQSSGSLHPLAS